jgi:hypothetical protein
MMSSFLPSMPSEQRFWRVHPRLSLVPDALELM